MGIIFKMILVVVGLLLVVKFAFVILHVLMQPQTLIVIAIAAAAVFLAGAIWNGFRHGSGEKAWQGGLDWTSGAFGILTKIIKSFLGFVFKLATNHKL